MRQRRYDMGFTVVAPLLFGGEMSRNLSQIKALLEDYEVKFIRLTFCDILGGQKNIAIMADQLDAAVEHGISFDASSIEGFGKINESDLFLHPDLDTFSILPWRPSQRSVARFFCTITYPDGRPFEGCGRTFLRQLEDEWAAAGYSFLCGPECEFYLFETDQGGRPTVRPFDRAGYFDMAPLDRGENVRRDICFALEEMNITPERSHHESGPGQNEIDFRASCPLAAADDFLSFKTAVKAIAGANGLFASFLPKPLKGESGSGLHVNLSLYRDGINQFSGFTDQARSFLAGIMRRIGELCVFTNPLPGSYDRLGRNEAPVLISWSRQNRSSLVRVPSAEGNDCRMEVRNPDCSCNPYFTFALLLAAGMEGIRDGLELCASYDQNSYDEEARRTLESLPLSLGEAVGRASSSTFVRSTLPEGLLDTFLEIKSRQAAQWDASMDREALELQHYFDYI